MLILHLWKPLIIVWASASILDDLTIVAKLAKLIQKGHFHSGNENPEAICDMCDEVMEDLLRGAETLSTVPCSWICLGASGCIKMCETIQDLTLKSTEFPCVAAGYCAVEDDYTVGFESEIACKKGPLFSCEPKKFCRKRRGKFSLKYTCDLKPGMGRWLHLKKAAQQHAYSMANGLLSQKHCGEPDAGPYCIAKPTGYGRVAEFFAWFLSILYGGYASAAAIESPGGDDDQQWLTFWVMFVASMLFEQIFARVILSKFPFYYQFKLIFVVWLMFFDGAATVYRWIRRRAYQLSPLLTGMRYNHNESNAQSNLDSIIRIGGKAIDDQIALLERQLRRNLKRRASTLFSHSVETESFWEYDYTNTKSPTNQTSLAAEERLYRISKWLLSSEGLLKIEDTLSSNTVAMVLERAAAVISFQPKFLNIHLISTGPGEKGKLPVMDANGMADCYVTFTLVSNKENYLRKRMARRESGYINLTGRTKLRYLNETVTSRIVYRTLEPQWNQMLELSVKGGIFDNDGTYRSLDVKDTILLVEAWDKDFEKWGIALEFFQVLGCALICVFLASYVLGIIDFLFNDNLTTDEWWWKTLIILSSVFTALSILLCWIMSIKLGADDDFIGKSAVPLEILTDQREHSLILKLRTKNEARGSLRVKLRLSEN